MGIILRNVKGNELTWDEVDGNFQSLYYSSSLNKIGPIVTFYFPSSSTTHNVDFTDVTFISSSVSTLTGSNSFGSACTDKQRFTGSLLVSGCASHHILGGNLGIGTIVPQYTLEVSGSGRIIENLLAGNGAGNTHRITGSLNIKGPTTIISTTGNPFLISMVDGNGQDDKVKVNSDGILVLGMLDTLPTAVTGGLAYSSSDFYFGFN